MKLEKLNLRLRVFLFFAFLALASIAVIFGGLAFGYQRAQTPQALSGFVLAGAVAGFGVLGLVMWIWFLFDENVARAIQRLAGGLLTRAHADVIDGIDRDSARYLGDLAPAAQAVTENLSETRQKLAAAVERQTEQLAQEKARLAALLADVPEGVLLSSGAHQLVFYNGSSVALLADDDAEPALNKSVFRYLRPGPIKAAYRRLRAGEEGASTNLLCATAQEGRILSARMRLLRQHDCEINGPGYVLTLRDVTSDLAVHMGREALLADIFDRIRRPAANLQTVIDATAEGAPLGDVLADEVSGLTRSVAELGARYDQSRASWWPKGEHRAADIVDGITAQLAHDDIAVTADAEKLRLNCDAYQIVALVTAVSEYLVSEQGAAVLSLLISPSDVAGEAQITIGWQGEPLSFGALDRWLDRPLDVGVADMTGRAVLQAHGTDMWPEPGKVGRSVLRLPIRQAQVDTEGPVADPRAAIYDFDLLAAGVSDDLLSTPLRDLTYVVFDTETTGLMPEQGDEIVQIAGVRLVNGRRVSGESFDSLVNPGRSIPPASTKVHGITEAMVANADPIESVGRRFHRFAEGAVLIAHNAPFDMAFLKRHARGIGASFDNPVLDTVLLSAVLYGQTEKHTLDALTERLGIAIPPDLRHTAMGDTVATADAFLKMLPILKGQGIETFGDILTEVRRHKRLLEDLN